MAVPKPSLQGAGVVTSVGQGKAAPVPEHVRVDGERQASVLPNPGKQGMKRLGRHGLGREHVRGWPLLALQAPQSADFVAAEPVLHSADVQAGRCELDLTPLEIASSPSPAVVCAGRPEGA